MRALEQGIIQRWYSKAGWLNLLLPLECLLRLIVRLKFKQRKHGADQICAETLAAKLSSPVIVVGNITVGGTGKSPLLASVVNYLSSKQYRGAVISRGYQASNSQCDVVEVNTEHSAEDVGDEPAMLRRQIETPIYVSTQRLQAAKKACLTNPDYIISDDGMQHYALPRYLEIAVIDGQRRLGNGHCLPVGPLREPKERLQSVDAIVLNGSGSKTWLKALSDKPVFTMQLQPLAFVNLKTKQRIAVDEWPFKQLQAVAGIGNPQRFFTTLDKMGLSCEGLAFSDHHAFSVDDFSFVGDSVLVMTEKDAIKCEGFAQDNWWYLSVEAQVEPAFYQWLEQKLSDIKPR